MNWSPQPRGSRMDPWDAESLQAQWPHIQWRQPIKVSTPAGGGFMCRVCTANQGFKAEDVLDLPQTREAFDQHMTAEHP